jgi:ribonucleoside-diphosphate reductase alpha chain
MQNYLPTDYQNFIALSRYARWKDDEQRRETWIETVDRYIGYMDNHLKTNYNYTITKALKEKLNESIVSLGTMPSMRALMTAGIALDRCHVAGYNCSYIPVDSPRSFDECMYILMCGTGVGFSVERENVDKLPVVNEHFEQSSTVIKVADSRPGWSRALRELISLLYAGQIPTWDVSEVRPAGARLKTFGGRASGPAPLIDLFKFCIQKFEGAKGRRLFPIECHDIMCKIGEVVVVGGVRRSALISLSNLGDDQMRHAKSGQWWENEGQRALANNSVAFKGKPEMGTFMREWTSLYESKSGERGIFNRKAAKVKASENGRRETEHEFGCNPCSEIILRPYQFCNLTEVVARETDDIVSLKDKVRMATILGTFQSTLTDFKYLRKVWKSNTEEERLLGVSLTGILDCPVLSPDNSNLSFNLQLLKEVAVETNKKIAKDLGIPQSTAITCIKPSGTVSQLVDSASGIHARHNPFYVRTVRGDNKDPLTQFMKESGIPAEPDVMKPDSTTVFSFPMKSPTGAITRTEMTAVQQLEYWLMFQRSWCEHKPSVTISVKEDEWMDVGAWVYRNFDEVSGISFLPFSDHTYAQAPYQDINEEEYKELHSKMPTSIDWSKLADFEKEDTTSGSKELACTADACEMVDIQAS